MGDALEIGSTFAGYRIDAMIGQGGMGVVYRAEQAQLERAVALKVITPQLAGDPAFRERFKRESRLAAAIEHANAIPIYEAGEAEGDVLYLAMRYIEGTDLGSLIGSEGPLEPRRAARIVDQVGGALDEAHARGLVHRDVKPANILIASRRGHEHAYLTDFGLTKPASAGVSGLTASGQWVGTVDYASPEQVEGKRVDARADVYALGCVLYTALTGRVPFERETDIAKLYAHASEPPPRPGEVAAAVGPELDAVVERALSKRPEDRFPSAGDLGRAAVAAAAGRLPSDAERTVAAGIAAPEPTVAAGDVPTAVAPGAAETEVAETEVAAASPPGSGRRSRRGLVAALVAGALAIAGILAIAGVFGGGANPGQLASGGGAEQGDGGGGGGGGGDRTSADYSELDTGAFSLEVPAEWEVTGTEKPVDDVGTRLRTEVLNPSGDSRLAINRRPADPATPDAQLREAESRARGQAGFKLLSTDELRLGGEDVAVMEFEIDDRDLGPSRAVAYFVAGSNGAYRLQATAKVDDPSLAADLDVARHAASTLST